MSLSGVKRKIKGKTLVSSTSANAHKRQATLENGNSPSLGATPTKANAAPNFQLGQMAPLPL